MLLVDKQVPGRKLHEEQASLLLKSYCFSVAVYYMGKLAAHKDLRTPGSGVKCCPRNEEVLSSN